MFDESKTASSLNTFVTSLRPWTQFSVTLAPELARTKRPTPPDVALLQVGVVLSAVAAQLVVTIGDIALA